MGEGVWAAWRRPLEVTDLGAFGPKVLLLPSSAQNTPPGCICGELDYKAVASYFLFLSQKESKQRKMLPPERCEKCFAPAGATRALPWTCKPLKRLDLNFRPFVTQWLSWVLPGVPTTFCPKRKTASHNLSRGDFNFSPSAASDSRHDLSQRTTVRRGAPGRVCVRALARRGAPGRVG